MVAELWGTLSVIDHKRPNAFVAELGLFDTLVVPVPPSGADIEDWSTVNWNGEMQAEVLSWIPDRKLRRVPWDARQRGLWAQRRVAMLAKADIDMIQMQREQERHLWPSAYEADDGESRSLGSYGLTRHLLQDYINQERDRELLAGMPDDAVDVIPAYDGPAAFLAAQQEDADDPDLMREPRQARLLRAFGWEFFEPSHEDRPGKALTHRQLIEASLEIEALPAVREHRQAFRAWTRSQALRGTEPEKAREEMEELLDRYARAVYGTGIAVQVRRACDVVEVGSAAIAVEYPWLGVVGPLMSLFRVRDWFDKPVHLPDEVRPAALLHGMRTTFAQAQVAGLALDTEMPLPLSRFWPGILGPRI